MENVLFGFVVFFAIVAVILMAVAIRLRDENDALKEKNAGISTHLDVIADKAMNILSWTPQAKDWLDYLVERAKVKKAAEFDLSLLEKLFRLAVLCATQKHDNNTIEGITAFLEFQGLFFVYK